MAHTLLTATHTRAADSYSFLMRVGDLRWHEWQDVCDKVELNFNFMQMSRLPMGAQTVRPVISKLIHLDI